MKKQKQYMFKHDSLAATGVLLTNLGTPDAPEPDALRRYLGEFLWDHRVVEIPRPLWWLILHGIILRTRPAKSAKIYRSIWTDEGSPLLVHLKRQASAVEKTLHSRVSGPVTVAFGMRYGSPSIADALAQLKRAACQRILVIPLYPQYSGATVGSTFDAVVKTLSRWRWVPELRMVNQYHDDPGYIAALAQSVQEHWQQHSQGQLLLFSFHGMPKRTLLAGDPYFCQCQKTARLVAEKLELDETQWRVVFQSRFGRAEWLQPYANKTLQALPKKGITDVTVICPGFSADCLETLEEMAMQNRDTFLKAGGEHYKYIAALNERPDHIDALCDVVVRHFQGWPVVDTNVDNSKGKNELDQRRERALALGAKQ